MRYLLAAIAVLVLLFNPVSSEAFIINGPVSFNTDFTEDSNGGVTINRAAVLPELNLSVTDPFPIGLPTDAHAANMQCYTSSGGVQPGFSDIDCLNVKMLYYYGDHTPGEKTTAIVNHQNMVAFGAGQKFVSNWSLNAFGSGDNQMLTGLVDYYGGVEVSGDEGPCGLCSTMTQPNFHSTAHVNGSVTVGGGNTTTTQAITGSQNVQTITVASSSGFTVGEWVEVNRASLPAAGLLREGVQLTAVGSGTISGIFRINQTSGVTITPAMVIPLSLGEFANYGVGRYLLNDSLTYSAGSISSWSGNAITGSGTGWSNGMVGGDATRPGCFAETADNTAAGVGTFFAIQSVNSSTSLTLETARNTDPPGGAYTIRPCVYILQVIPQVGNPAACCSAVVVETNTFSWANGNVIETAYGPSMAAFNIHLVQNDWLPESGGNTVMQIDEQGGVAPEVFLKLVNFTGHARPLNGAIQNTFIQATNIISGQFSAFASSSGTDNFMFASLTAGGIWGLDRYGLNEQGFVENSFSALQGLRGGPIVAGALETDPTWQFNTNPHVLWGANITDTSGRSDNDFMRFQVGGVDKWRVRADGTILVGQLSPSIPGVYALFQNNIPFIVAPTGTMGNNGAITLGTALQTTYGNGVFLYLPANAISTGSAAGWYCAVMSSTTVGQVYNNTYTTGQPVNCYGVGTPFVSTGPGAYTGVTTAVMGPNTTIPGNGGNNFTYRVGYVSTVNPTANGKFTTLSYGGQSLATLNTTAATTFGQTGTFAFWNNPVGQFGVVSVPFSVSGTNNIPTPGLTRANVDMTQPQVVGVQISMASATDYVGIEHLTVEEIQGP